MRPLLEDSNITQLSFGIISAGNCEYVSPLSQALLGFCHTQHPHTMTKYQRSSSDRKEKPVEKKSENCLRRNLWQGWNLNGQSVCYSFRLNSSLNFHTGNYGYFSQCIWCGGTGGSSVVLICENFLMLVILHQELIGWYLGAISSWCTPFSIERDTRFFTKSLFTFTIQ